MCPNCTGGRNKLVEEEGGRDEKDNRGAAWSVEPEGQIVLQSSRGGDLRVLLSRVCRGLGSGEKCLCPAGREWTNVKGRDNVNVRLKRRWVNGSSGGGETERPGGKTRTMYARRLNLPTAARGEGPDDRKRQKPRKKNRRNGDDKERRPECFPTARLMPITLHQRKTPAESHTIIGGGPRGGSEKGGKKMRKRSACHSKDVRLIKKRFVGANQGSLKTDAVEEHFVGPVCRPWRQEEKGETTGAPVKPLTSRVSKNMAWAEPLCDEKRGNALTRRMNSLSGLPTVVRGEEGERATGASDGGPSRQKIVQNRPLRERIGRRQRKRGGPREGI